MNLIKLLPLVLCTIFIFPSSKDHHDDVINPPSTVKNNFTRQFPNARAVQWEKENEQQKSYLKAEFKVNGTEKEAWYSYNGTWVRTETDYKKPLPASIHKLIATNYPGYRVDDVDWVETPKVNYFDIDLEKGKSDIKLLVKKDGTILDTEGDQNHIPSAVLLQLQKRFPGAKVKEWEKEGSLHKAEFIYKRAETEAWFTPNGKWVKTEKDFRSALPVAVKKHIQSHYKGYKVDDVNWVETPQKNFFEIELEKDKSDVVLLIQKDGTVLSARPDND